MINPQENPHLLTQDYFEELLEKIYPGFKVNDIIPYHYQGSQSGLNPFNNAMFYGYFTGSTGADGPLTVECPLRDPMFLFYPSAGFTMATMQFFGLASRFYDADYPEMPMTFHGFRATFDNTPAPPASPTPQPPAVLFRISSVASINVLGSTVRNRVDVQGVPNSTVHCQIDFSGTTGITGTPNWVVGRYDGTEVVGSGFFSPLPSNFNFDVVLDAFGNANFEFDTGNYNTDAFQGVIAKLTGATAGSAGSPVSTTLKMPLS